VRRAIFSFGHPLQGLVDLEKRVLLLREEIEREVAVVGVTAGVGLVQPVGGSLVGIMAGTQIVAGHAGHGIKQGVLQSKQTQLLLLQPRVEAAFFGDGLTEGQHVARPDQRRLGRRTFADRNMRNIFGRFFRRRLGGCGLFLRGHGLAFCRRFFGGLNGRIFLFCGGHGLNTMDGKGRDSNERRRGGARLFDSVRIRAMGPDGPPPCRLRLRLAAPPPLP
jgi:hypothetical protein